MAQLQIPTIISPSGNTINSSSVTFTIEHPFATSDAGTSVQAQSYGIFSVYDVTDGRWIISQQEDSTSHGTYIQSSINVSGLQAGHRYTFSAQVKADPNSIYYYPSEAAVISVTYAVTASVYIWTPISTTSNSASVPYTASNCLDNAYIYYYYSTSNSTPGNSSNWINSGITYDSSQIPISNLQSSMTYYVWLACPYNTSTATASNIVTISGNTCARSSVGSFTTSASTPTYSATAPGTITANATSSTSITVSWSAGSSSSNNTITGYQVGYSTSYSGTKTTVSVSGSSTLSKTITGLRSNTTYYFWVKTICQNQNSDWSTAYDYAATQASFTPPSITAVSVSNLQATISVNTGSCTGTIYYRYITSDEYNIHGSNYEYSPDSGSSSQNPIVITVPSEGQYYFQVNMYGTEDWVYSNVFGPRNFTAPYTRCTNPNSINFSRTRGTLTITWAGAQDGSGGNSITGYDIKRNTSASESGATTLSSTSSTSITDTPPTAGTYYYGIKTIGTISGYDALNYAWSDPIEVPFPPEVTAGTTITKTQMDNLRSYINSPIPTAVTQNATITATVGNTYKNNLIAGTTQITAEWYNYA